MAPRAQEGVQIHGPPSATPHRRRLLLGRLLLGRRPPIVPGVVTKKVLGLDQSNVLRLQRGLEQHHRAQCSIVEPE
ncbi:hypothetical protein ACFX1Q_018267 [Malus domestica]